MDDIKNFLYAWLGKKHKVPNYHFTQQNIKNRQRFKCECKADGFKYIGIGNSTNKKDAQSNAALDFCQFLVRSGFVNKNDLPNFERNFSSNDISASSLPCGLIAPHQSMGLSFNDFSVKDIPAYKPGPSSSYMSHIKNFIVERKMLEDAEDSDLNAEIHGFWSLENAKSRLHQYLQINRIQTDYKYTSTGADNSKSFFAEMHFFDPKTNKRINANEHGSTKQMASKACALSLVRQLYHLGVIEKFSGESKKKEKTKTVPYFVHFNDDLKKSLKEVCDIFNIEYHDQNTSLILKQKNKIVDNQEIKPGSSIIWSPPLSNWNAWMACNIDEGPLANMDMSLISKNLHINYNSKLSDGIYQQKFKDRKNLPVANFKQEILQAINANSIIIVRGATGCGKTTQIPQYILESFLSEQKGSECNIIVTQPRRISAVSVAERVAFEQHEELGQSIGYSVRFDSVLPRPFGGILFCTVGVLLRKLENGLRGISHVIVDEIHERDINTDFLLVLLKDMLIVNKNLKVILMSATIDTSLFKTYFNNCPIIDIYGQTYPVQEYFLEDLIQILDFTPCSFDRKKRKDDDDDDDEEECIADDQDVDCNSIIGNDYSEKTKFAMRQLSEKILSFELIESLLKYITELNQPGSILIFLPGWNLILSLLKYLQNSLFFGTNKFILLPLHSQIPKEDQYKVFDDAPPGKTKIILSTNIAESSITINDIVYVIDSCKVKQKIFTSHNNMTNYATVWASKSNLQQRKGRAGRVRSGYCFYMISRARYEKLDNHATPEIFRTPLLELALSIKLLKLGEIKDFLSRAIEPPPMDAVAEAIVALSEMNALNHEGDLTSLGKILARLPIEPKLGKMIVIACCLNVGDAACIIAAATTFGEPFIIDGKYLRYMHRNLAGRRSSDHVALLIAFQQWLKSKWHGEEAERKFCEKKFLNMQTLRMTYDAKNQLKDILLMSGFPEECLSEFTSFDSNYNDSKLDIICSLLAYALYPNVCFHVDKRKLITADGKFALIHKNSVNCSREIPKFICPFFVFGEKIKTRAVSAKQLTMVTPAQLLLFCCGKIDFTESDNSLICLDNWIYLRIEQETVRFVLSMRQALDQVLTDCTEQPILISSKSQKIQIFSKTLTQLSDSTGNYLSFKKETENNDTVPTKTYNHQSKIKTFENFNKKLVTESNNLSSISITGSNISNDSRNSELSSENFNSNETRYLKTKKVCTGFRQNQSGMQSTQFRFNKMKK